MNTRTHGVVGNFHALGKQGKDNRRIKAAKAERGKIGSSKRHGRDYTPLFRFLLSKVGEPWDDVHSEAVSRLETPEPIGWIVATNELDERAFIGTAEGTYYAGLRVDHDGRLAWVQPDLTAEDLPVNCTCCTHTFNGMVYGRDVQEEMRANRG